MAFIYKAYKDVFIRLSITVTKQKTSRGVKGILFVCLFIYFQCFKQGFLYGTLAILELRV